MPRSRSRGRNSGCPVVLGGHSIPITCWRPAPALKTRAAVPTHIPIDAGALVREVVVARHDGFEGSTGVVFAVCVFCYRFCWRGSEVVVVVLAPRFLEGGRRLASGSLLIVSRLGHLPPMIYLLRRRPNIIDFSVGPSPPSSGVAESSVKDGWVTVTPRPLAGVW